jgi:hypothetical protein
MLSCSRNCTKFSKKFNLIVFTKQKIFLMKKIHENDRNHKFGGECLVVLVIAQSLSEKKSTLKVHKIENFFDSDFGICLISLLVMSKY